jgi:hypothetical protein
VDILHEKESKIMRTRLAYEELLTRLMNSGELTPDMEEDFRRLKDELDEREGMLEKYGETYDGENKEYDWVAREVKIDGKEDGSDDVVQEDESENKVIDTPEENVIDWEAKYRDLKQRYVDRFMGRIKEENLADMRNDLERGRDDGGEGVNEVTYDDLFK